MHAFAWYNTPLCPKRTLARVTLEGTAISLRVTQFYGGNGPFVGDMGEA
jgi:hypothetical protein